ncbi:TlpA family protein disulfide reductase [Alcaligenes sp. WGS1538]|uniref:TlpA family protein disulfide reductase n=1 Tax=Alcaligenes sp. WGS1538 TaxID=3366811 RepID=UPI00372D570B
MQSIQLGPFTFATSLFAFMAAAIAALLLAAWLDRRSRTRAESALWRGLLLGLLAGRLGFLVQQWDYYRHAPLSWMDLRDGGLMLPAAAAVALAYWLWRGLRDKAMLPALSGGLAIGLAAFALIMSWAGAMQTQEPRVLPAVALQPVQAQADSPAGLQGYQGKLTVVNLWASWCPPCRREMPAFKQVQSSRDDVHIVFANQGEEADVIRQYLDKEKLELANMWRDPQMQLGQAVRSRGLPTTLFLDAQGRLLDVRAGELSAATLNDRIDRLM